MYALNLADDGRILSAAIVLPKGKYDGMPIVDTLPDGNLYEYRYADGEIIHDPLPAVEAETEQPTEELLLEMAADHEYRLCLIELGVSEDDL